VYLRPSIDGEFTGAVLPPNLRSEDVKFVLVRRLPYWQGQEKIPLSMEMAKQLRHPAIWKKVVSEREVALR